jgi:hypothetical protein
MSINDCMLLNWLIVSGGGGGGLAGDQNLLFEK